MKLDIIDLLFGCMVVWTLGMVLFCFRHHWPDLAAFFGVLGLTVLLIAVQKADPKERR